MNNKNSGRIKLEFVWKVRMNKLIQADIMRIQAHRLKIKEDKLKAKLKKLDADKATDASGKMLCVKPMTVKEYMDMVRFDGVVNEINAAHAACSLEFAHSHIMVSQANCMWADAVLKACGNITMHWKSCVHCILGNGQEFGFANAAQKRRWEQMQEKLYASR